MYLLKRKEVWIGALIPLLILSPQPTYNHTHFGSVFKTGYGGGSPISRSVVSMVNVFPLRNFRLHNTIHHISCMISGFGPPTPPFYHYGIWHLIQQKNREKLSLLSKLLHDLECKVGISSSKATDRWDVYLVTN